MSRQQPRIKDDDLGEAATVIEADLNQQLIDGAPVATLLAESRTAHTAYRLFLSDKNPTAARASLATAARLRSEAQTADPLHVTPAWDAEPEKFDHVALMQFYVTELSKA